MLSTVVASVVVVHEVPNGEWLSITRGDFDGLLSPNSNSTKGHLEFFKILPTQKGECAIYMVNSQDK